MSNIDGATRVILKHALASISDEWRVMIDPDPVRWIQTHFRIPETKDHRMVLSPYQIRALREALTVDKNGLFRYSIILWSDIKKSIKSCLAAANGIARVDRG